MKLEERMLLVAVLIGGDSDGDDDDEGYVFNIHYYALPLFGRGPNIRLWQYCWPVYENVLE